MVRPFPVGSRQDASDVSDDIHPLSNPCLVRTQAFKDEVHIDGSES